MQKHLLCVMIALSSIILLNSCGKDDEPAPPEEKSKTTLITQSSWKFEKALSGGIEVSTYIPACWKDNIAVFAIAGTGTLDESANICPTSAAGPFTWSFQTSETMLLLSAPLFSGGSNSFTIVDINETNLVVSQVVTVPTIGAQNVVFYFKH